MRTFLVGFLIALAMTAAAPAAPDPKKTPDHDDAVKLADKLLERIDLTEPFTNVQIRELLEYLTKRLDMNILIDRRAFAGEADGELLDKAVSVPAMKRVRVETILKLIADQIDGEIYIAPDHVSITTPAAKDLLTGRAKLLAELDPNSVGGDDAEVDRNVRVRATPYVTGEFRDISLADAVKSISTRTGRNVVISQAASEKAKGLVNVRLSNVAFEIAVATLSEATGLRAYRTGNVVVVVTPERAKEVDAASRANMGQGFCGGPFLGGPTPEQMDAVNKLIAQRYLDEKKELEEKVRKLMEELEKARKK